MTEKKIIPCEVWSRLVGYYRPFTVAGKPAVNPGKIQEFKDRKVYEVPANEERTGCDA